MTLAQVDAGILMVWVVCALILAQEDGILTSLTRIPVLVVGAGAFYQSLWLVGIWEPGPAGFPLARIALDGAVASAFVTRAVEVLLALKHNSGRLLAIRPFGVVKRERDHGPAGTS